MDSRFSLQWDVGEQHGGKLLREFLHEQEISKSALTDIKFKGGSIMVNGETVNVRCRLQKNDRIQLIFPLEESSEGLKGEDIPLNVLYEDEYVLVVNKPAGMNTIPSREHPSGSLANALIGYYGKNKIDATAHIVTHLDRDTSGIVLIAKHRHVHHLLSKQQKAGHVKRTYEAFSEGKFVQDEGTVAEPIGRNPESIIEREVRNDGQYACTHYKVITRLEHFTHLELTLETGRTHQIRVHMSHLGHPLLGDDLYGGKRQKIQRQALHCKQIRFIHPIIKKEMSFYATMPKDMQMLLN